MNHPAKLALVTCIALGSPAFAQQAGTWSASVGVTQISPAVKSGDLSPPSFTGTTADVSSNTQLTAALNYALTDAIGLHLPLGLGFKHKITGTGAIAGVGVIATTKALPITAIAQYRFMDAQSSVRPYIGAGLTYAKFYKEKGTAALTAITNPGGSATTLSLESKLAPTLQLGVVFNINEKWYLDASYTKTFLKTRATLSTGQTLDATLNPNGYTLQLGYKF